MHAACRCLAGRFVVVAVRRAVMLLISPGALNEFVCSSIDEGRCCAAVEWRRHVVLITGNLFVLFVAYQLGVPRAGKQQKGYTTPAALGTPKRGGIKGSMCTVHYLCGKPPALPPAQLPAQPPTQPPAQPQYTQKVLIVSPSQNGPSREKTLWPQTLYKKHLFPTNTAQRNQEHNTIGIHFIIVDIVLGPL